MGYAPVHFGSRTAFLLRLRCYFTVAHTVPTTVYTYWLHTLQLRLVHTTVRCLHTRLLPHYRTLPHMVLPLPCTVYANYTAVGLLPPTPLYPRLRGSGFTPTVHCRLPFGSPPHTLPAYGSAAVPLLYWVLVLVLPRSRTCRLRLHTPRFTHCAHRTVCYTPPVCRVRLRTHTSFRCHTVVWVTALPLRHTTRTCRLPFFAVYCLRFTRTVTVTRLPAVTRFAYTHVTHHGCVYVLTFLRLLPTFTYTVGCYHWITVTGCCGLPATWLRAGSRVTHLPRTFGLVTQLRFMRFYAHTRLPAVAYAATGLHRSRLCLPATATVWVGCCRFVPVAGLLPVGFVYWFTAPLVLPVTCLCLRLPARAVLYLCLQFTRSGYMRSFTPRIRAHYTLPVTRLRSAGLCGYHSYLRLRTPFTVRYTHTFVVLPPPTQFPVIYAFCLRFVRSAVLRLRITVVTHVGLPRSHGCYAVHATAGLPTVRCRFTVAFCVLRFCLRGYAPATAHVYSSHCVLQFRLPFAYCHHVRAHLRLLRSLPGSSPVRLVLPPGSFTTYYGLPRSTHAVYAPHTYRHRTHFAVLVRLIIPFTTPLHTLRDLPGSCVVMRLRTFSRYVRLRRVCVCGCAVLPGSGSYPGCSLPHRYHHRTSRGSFTVLRLPVWFYLRSAVLLYTTVLRLPPHHMPVITIAGSYTPPVLILRLFYPSSTAIPTVPQFYLPHGSCARSCGSARYRTVTVLLRYTHLTLPRLLPHVTRYVGYFYRLPRLVHRACHTTTLRYTGCVLHGLFTTVTVAAPFGYVTVWFTRCAVACSCTVTYCAGSTRLRFTHAVLTFYLCLPLHSCLPTVWFGVYVLHHFCVRCRITVTHTRSAHVYALRSAVLTFRHYTAYAITVTRLPLRFYTHLPAFLPLRLCHAFGLRAVCLRFHVLITHFTVYTCTVISHYHVAVPGYLYLHLRCGSGFTFATVRTVTRVPHTTFCGLRFSAVCVRTAARFAYRFVPLRRGLPFCHRGSRTRFTVRLRIHRHTTARLPALRFWFTRFCGCRWLRFTAAVTCFYGSYLFWLVYCLVALYLHCLPCYTLVWVTVTCYTRARHAPRVLPTTTPQHLCRFYTAVHAACALLRVQLHTPRLLLTLPTVTARSPAVIPDAVTAYTAHLPGLPRAYAPATTYTPTVLRLGFAHISYRPLPACRSTFTTCSACLLHTTCCGSRSRLRLFHALHTVWFIRTTFQLPATPAACRRISLCLPARIRLFTTLGSGVLWFRLRTPSHGYCVVAGLVTGSGSCSSLYLVTVCGLYYCALPHGSVAFTPHAVPLYTVLPFGSLRCTLHFAGCGSAGYVPLGLLVVPSTYGWPATFVQFAFVTPHWFTLYHHIRLRTLRFAAPTRYLTYVLLRLPVLTPLYAFTCCPVRGCLRLRTFRAFCSLPDSAHIRLDGLPRCITRSRLPVRSAFTRSAWFYPLRLPHSGFYAGLL